MTWHLFGYLKICYRPVGLSNPGRRSTNISMPPVSINTISFDVLYIIFKSKIFHWLNCFSCWACESLHFLFEEFWSLIWGRVRLKHFWWAYGDSLALCSCCGWFVIWWVKWFRVLILHWPYAKLSFYGRLFKIYKSLFTIGKVGFTSSQFSCWPWE